MLRELIRRGPDAGDNGPEWDAIFVDLREAVNIVIAMNKVTKSIKIIVSSVSVNKVPTSSV